MENIQTLLEFVGVLVGTLLAISAFTPKGYRAVKISFTLLKRYTLDDIYDRLEALEGRAKEPAE